MGSPSKTVNDKIKDKSRSTVTSRVTVNQSKDSNPDMDVPSTSNFNGFVLPTRSVHSSRIIKPNKRFLEENSNSIPPLKKTCIVPSKEYSTNSLALAKEVNKHPATFIDLTKSPPRNSAIKIVLRKPILKIKTDNLKQVGGPFSSPSTSTFAEKLTEPKKENTSYKLVCAVCGLQYPCKLLKHARVFGIFCCPLCRNFIFEFYKSMNNDTVKSLACINGNGLCQIRHTSFEPTTTFPNDSPQKEIIIFEAQRCKGCWLYCCIRSFKFSSRIQEKLESYLPDVYPKKQLYNSLPLTNNFKKVDKPIEKIVIDKPAVDKTLCVTEKRIINYKPEIKIDKPEDNISKPIVTTISIDNTILNVTITTSPSKSNTTILDTKEGYKPIHRAKIITASTEIIKQDIKQSKEVKKCVDNSKKKTRGPGPRVKHVCRSATIVLGQPIATFPEKETDQVEVKKLRSDRLRSGSISDKSDSDANVNNVNILQKVVDDHSTSENENHRESLTTRKSVARMLQELGRDNCALLEGIDEDEIHDTMNSKLFIDYWQNYDPDEVSRSGFPLIGYGQSFRLKAICFLCGSAGNYKLIHCACCCEPYHTFCLTSLGYRWDGSFQNDNAGWWRLDWVCPRCTPCNICSEPGGVLLSCSKCQKSFHSQCINNNSSLIKAIDTTWICPTCLSCISCNTSNVKYVFVGNLPLCNPCFKLRKKGNYCPLCQGCYDDNDFDTQMMECGDCKSWIHAKCEGITDEKYQILSYLPQDVEFICRSCCRSPPAQWITEVDLHLKTGFNKVLKLLSSNRKMCAIIKSSPRKQSCPCRDIQRKPIHLSSLSDEFSSVPKSYEKTVSVIDGKGSKVGLLTPKMTQHDEESLKNNKYINKNAEFMTNVFKLQNNLLLNLTNPTKELENNMKKFEQESFSGDPDRICICSKNDKPTLNLMNIKCKANSSEYKSVTNFHKDMEIVINSFQDEELLLTYNKVVEQVFPWFNFNNSPSSNNCDKKVTEVTSNIKDNRIISTPKKDSLHEIKPYSHLLNYDSGYYYNNLNFIDERSCMFCKKFGDGSLSREERLLYCGQNEWVHANCALWSNEVFEEIDGSLQNVQSAVSRSRLIRCNYCDKKGASIGCCARSCSLTYHFSCAVDANCIFMESKDVYCYSHSLQNNKERHKDFSIKRSMYIELDLKKKKDFLKDDVRFMVGSLYVESVGQIDPDVSDYGEVLLPKEYSFSRFFWSTREPWKVVEYRVKVKMDEVILESLKDTENNYTINHSVVFTPPPSPPITQEQFNKISNILDSACFREEDNSYLDHQTELLPPELKNAIFEDLFVDELLNDISMQEDIIPQICKLNNFEMNADVERNDKCQNDDRICVKQVGSKDEEDNLLKKNNNNKSFRSFTPLLQVDGAVDLSDSETSNDASDVNLCQNISNNVAINDEPVKCAKCSRTYRSMMGYTNHLSSCNSEDYLNDMDSESTEDEMEFIPTQSSAVITNETISNIIKINCETEVNNDESFIINERINETNIVINNNVGLNNCSFIQNQNQLCYETIPNQSQSQSIVIQGNTAGILPTYTNSYQPETIFAPTLDNQVQYIIESPVKPQVLNNTLYQCPIQSAPICQIQTSPVLNNIPTVLGTVLQPQHPQLVLNTSYNPQPTVLVANSPLVLNMDSTLIGNSLIGNQFPTIQPIVDHTYAGAQFFQVPKPAIELPQSYLLVNSGQLIPTNNICPTTVLPQNTFSFQCNEPITIQDNVAYQTITKVCEEKKINVEIVSQKPVMNQQKRILSKSRKPIYKNNILCIRSKNDSVINTNYKQSQLKSVVSRPSPWGPIRTNQVKTVDLPDSSAILKEKPQQAVAPVVFKKVETVLPISHNVKKISSIEMKNNRIRTEINGPNLQLSNTGTLPLKEIKENITTMAVPSIVGMNHPQNSNSVSNANNNFTDLELPIKITTYQVVERSKNKVANSAKDDVYEFKDSSETCNSIPPFSPANRRDQTKLSSPINDKCNNSLNNLEFDNSALDIELIHSESIFCENNFSSVVGQNDSHKTAESENIISESNIIPDRQKTEETLSSHINNELLKPKIMFEVVSSDGFSYITDDPEKAWNEIFKEIQKARTVKGLPLMPQNPYNNSGSIIKQFMGLGNNGIRYVIEQLPKVSRCVNYQPKFYKKQLSAYEEEMRKKDIENLSGCARCEPMYKRKTNYDMFSWLASRFRRPPKLLSFDNEIVNGVRRTSSSNLPMAMRYRNLKETAKLSVGVFRSDIHGRGLFCLRDIECGEMVIEYAGEVIRSSLTDIREEYYNSKGIGCYMFRIDDQFVVDATMKGNAARFINHSCEPNCYSRVVDILGMKHILIFALRRIDQGEELTYDYKFPLEDEKINCHCLSRKCRKYLN